MFKNLINIFRKKCMHNILLIGIEFLERIKLHVQSDATSNYILEFNNPSHRLEELRLADLKGFVLLCKMLILYGTYFIPIIFFSICYTLCNGILILRAMLPDGSLRSSYV